MVFSTGSGFSMGLDLAGGRIGGVRQAGERSNNVGCLGDSITSNAYGSNAGATFWQLIGYATWLRQLTRQKINLPSTNLFATSGYTTAQIITTHLPGAIAANLDVCVVHCASNDVVNTGIALATIKSNLNTIFQALLENGTAIVAIPPMPRVSLSATIRKRMDNINRWINEYARSHSGVRVLDMNPIFTDATHASGDPISGVLLADGIHPCVNGAYLIARELAPIVMSLIQPNEMRITSTTDVYDATHNPLGSLITNGLLNGTGGTAGTGTTGTVADSWQIIRASGSGEGTASAAGSKVSRTDGDSGAWQQIVVTGTPTEYYNFGLEPTSAITTNFATGDTLYMEAEFEIDPGATGLMAVSAYLARNSFTYIGIDGYPNNVSTGTYNSTDFIRGVLRTEPMLLPSGVTSFSPRLVLGLQDDTACSFTVRFGRISLRKVI